MTSLTYSAHFLKAMAAATVFQLPQRSRAGDLCLREESIETAARQRDGADSPTINPHAA